AFAYVGDQTKAGSRGKAMALTGACIGTAAIIGPAVGGIMAARSKADYVVILVAVLFFISLFLIYKFIEESLKSTEKGKLSFSEFLPLIQHPLDLQASLAALSIMISNRTLASALP